MPAFSLTTPRKPVSTETPPSTHAAPHILENIGPQPPVQGTSRAKASSPKFRPQIPHSKAKGPTSRIKAKQPRAKAKAKAPSRHNKPPTPSPPSSDAEEIKVDLKKGKSNERKHKPAAPTPAFAKSSTATTDDLGSGSELVSYPSTPSISKPTRKAATRPIKPPTLITSKSSATEVSSSTATSHVNAPAVLELLGEVVDAEFTYWKHYLSTIEKSSTSYDEITDSSHSNPRSTPGDAETHIEEEDQDQNGTRQARQKQKQEALIHILETLPLRYKAVQTAYACDVEGDMEYDNIVLSADLQNLLILSQKSPNERGDGDETDELEGWFDSRIFSSKSNKKFRDDVLAMDEEVKYLENSRMENLILLMGRIEDLKLLAIDGDCEDEALRGVIGAMDEMGLSATSSRLG